MTLFPSLLYLAGTQDFPDQEHFERHLRTLLDAGLPWFQFREKRLDDGPFYALSARIREWTRASGCLLSINDRPDIALLCEADGVHLGQEDLSALDPVFVRPAPSFHLGISTRNAAEVRRALTVRPDYLGVGPVYPTGTKVTGVPPRGPAALRETRELSTLPLVAIGGIGLKTAPELFAAGAQTIAVSAILVRAPDPASLMTALLSIRPPR